MWAVSNDNIEVCKECKYRYACYDSSEIVMRNGKYEKKYKCSYDVKNNKWAI